MENVVAIQPQVFPIYDAMDLLDELERQVVGMIQSLERSEWQVVTRGGSTDGGGYVTDEETWQPVYRPLCGAGVESADVDLGDALVAEACGEPRGASGAAPKDMRGLPAYLDDDLMRLAAQVRYVDPVCHGDADDDAGALPWLWQPGLGQLCELPGSAQGPGQVATLYPFVERDTEGEVRFLEDAPEDSGVGGAAAQLFESVLTGEADLAAGVGKSDLAKVAFDGSA